MLCARPSCRGYDTGRTPTVGKPTQGTLQGTFADVFKRAAALELGELLLWKSGGDFRRARQEVDAEFARLDCVFCLDSEEGRYGVRKKRRKAPVVASPPPAPRPLVSETSVPTAERVVELIAGGRPHARGDP
jgi:hypothetical protein